MNRATTLAFGSLLAAIALWAGVWYALTMIQTQAAEHAGLVARAQDLATKDETLAKLRVLLTETKPDRDLARALVPGDVIMVVDSFDAAAKEAGIPIQLGNAIAVGSSKKDSQTTAVAFVIQAEGTFAQVTRLAELLGNLPNPSVIEQLDLSRGGSNLWALTVRVRAMVTNSST